MTTLKTRTVDTSTICPGKGSGMSLPVLPRGTKVKVFVPGKSSSTTEGLEIVSGFSTEYQLCTQKGAGLALHNLLAGASSQNPLEVILVWGE